MYLLISPYSLLLNILSFPNYDCSSIPEGSNKSLMSADLWGHLGKNWNFQFSKMKKTTSWQDLSTCGFSVTWSTWACQVQLLYQGYIIWPAQMLVLVQSCWTIQVPPIGKIERGKATEAKITALLWDSPACPGCSYKKKKKRLVRPLEVPTNLFTLFE